MVRDFNAEYKDSELRKYGYDFDWIVRRYLLKRVSPFLKREGDSLELGCYQGEMTEQILGYVNKLSVIEAASDLAELVAQKFPTVNVINSTFETAAFNQGFDNIFLVHTLEHLDEPVDQLRRFAGWLSPTGRLIVAVPNANALSRQIAVKMGLISHNSAITPGEKEHGHRVTYSSDVLLSHLRQAGLEVVEHGGILLKALANFQMDKSLAAGIIDENYLEGCYELGKSLPDYCASLYAVCRKP